MSPCRPNTKSVSYNHLHKSLMAIDELSSKHRVRE